MSEFERDVIDRLARLEVKVDSIGLAEQRVDERLQPLERAHMRMGAFGAIVGGLMGTVSAALGQLWVRW